MNRFWLIRRATPPMPWTGRSKPSERLPLRSLPPRPNGQGGWEGWPRMALAFGAGSAAGAGLMYVLDPERGRRRRALARDRSLASVRHLSQRAGRFGRRTGAEVYGLVQRATHLLLRPRPPEGDDVLTDRVLSEAFRGRDVPPGRVNVNVEQGTVVLRGQLDRPDQIREIVDAVRKVDGVREVESYLHLPETPPPNKEAALEAD